MLGAICGFTRASASIDARIPLPIAVPTAVLKPSMASLSRSRSSVGGTTICALAANTTMPMRVPLGLGVDEAVRGLLRRGEAVRLRRRWSTSTATRRW